MFLLILLLVLLGAVLAAALLAGHTGGIEDTTDDVIAHTWQILYAAATDHDDRVFLEVVTFTGDISSDFHAIGQTDTSNLAESGVRFLRGGRGDLDAHTTLERTIVERVAVLYGIDGIRHGWRLRFLGRGSAGTLDELVDGGHRS